MSTRFTLRPQPVIKSGDMSLTSLTSAPTVLGSLTKVGYAYSWAGSSPVGTIAVQVSNDYSLDSAGKVANVGTWTPLELELAGAPVTSIPVSGNSGTGFIDLATVGAYAIRTVYTKVSGTGTLQATITGKVS